MTLGQIIRHTLAILAITALTTSDVMAQVTPKPFPQPGQQQPPPPPTKQPPATTTKQPPPSTPPASRPSADTPNEATLGVPIYPTAQFLTSYDAGRGQRFYLFGVSANYLEIVTFYRNVLKNKGTELFESPPTHQFDTGRFREEAMAFPPSVTVKDYTWGGSAGYPNPRRGAQPARFATIIQIVPVLPGSQQN